MLPEWTNRQFNLIPHPIWSGSSSPRWRWQYLKFHLVNSSNFVAFKEGFFKNDHFFPITLPWKVDKESGIAIERTNWLLMEVKTAILKQTDSRSFIENSRRVRWKAESEYCVAFNMDVYQLPIEASYKSQRRLRCACWCSLDSWCANC
jgi:hypothetical protein